MATSQNVEFVGASAQDPEFDHPAGRPMIVALSTHLRSAGWSVGEPEDWRDCGWSVNCDRSAAALHVCLAMLPDERWMMQAAPARIPGLLRLLGRKASATPADVRSLARTIHPFLLEQGFSEIRWLWDGFPSDGAWSPEPSEPTEVTAG